MPSTAASTSGSGGSARASPCRAMAPESGHNERVTGRRLLARVVLVGALALGVIGMHHLVIAACHHLGVTHVATAAVDPHAGHAMPMDAPTSPTSAPDSPTPAGAVGAAVMCLAVLLLIVLVLAPRAWADLRRSGAHARVHQALIDLGEVARPPDLVRLSVSRT